MKSTRSKTLTLIVAGILVIGMPGSVFAQNKPQAKSEPGKGAVEHIKVHGKSLEGNLEGDSPDRDVFIYLPPSYATNKNKRYPVVYLLHGFGLTAERWMPFANLQATSDKGIAAGAMKEMILVSPDAFTKYSGSMYSTSVTTGDWEAFIADDLVSYVDSHYRTLPNRMSRGLAGHSMGGYGTIRIGMKRPDVFSSMYIMSACCLLNNPGGQGNRGAAAGAGNRGAAGGANRGAATPAAVPTGPGVPTAATPGAIPPAAATPGATAPANPAPAAPAVSAANAGNRGNGTRGQGNGGQGNRGGRGGQGGRGGGLGNAQLAEAAAWSANPKNPPDYYDTPTKDGQPQPLVIAKWQANSPLVMVDQYATNLKKYHAIMGDVGTEDGLAASNRQLDQAMTDLGVNHVFETYEGNHTNRVPLRFEQKVLPFFSSNLSFVAPKK